MLSARQVCAENLADGNSRAVAKAFLVVGPVESEAFYSHDLLPQLTLQPQPGKPDRRTSHAGRQ